MASEARFPLSPRKQSSEEERRPRTRVEDENALERVYHMGEILGQGSFGVVKEATHHITGKKFAIKAVSKDKVSQKTEPNCQKSLTPPRQSIWWCAPLQPGSTSIQLLDREIEVLMRVNHTHIIHLEEVFETPKVRDIGKIWCKAGQVSHCDEEKAPAQLFCCAKYWLWNACPLEQNYSKEWA